MNTGYRNVSVLVLILGLMFGLGCESSDRAAQETGKNGEKVSLVFEEASGGLPSSGRWRQGLAFCDLNHDGHMDILAPPPRLAQEGEAYTVPTAWLGNGKGGWSRVPLKVPDDVAYDYGGIACGDFNGDDILDVGLAMHGQRLLGLKGMGDLKYEKFSSGLPEKSEFVSRAVVSADFNNDGISDLAALSEAKFNSEAPEASGVQVCYGGRDGWACQSLGESIFKEVKGLFGDQLATGDVNGDGHTDIAVSTLDDLRDLIVWVNNGKGDFIPFNKGLPRHVHYPWVDLEDMDGDGKDDLIASISSFGKEGGLGIRVFLYRPEGFEEMTEGGLPSKEVFFAVQGCDLNNDGRLEIVGASGTGAIEVFSLDGEKWHRLESVPGLPKPLPGRISGLYCRDLNGDGKKDIVVNFSGRENRKAGGIRVFLNKTGQGSESKS